MSTSGSLEGLLKRLNIWNWVYLQVRLCIYALHKMSSIYSNRSRIGKRLNKRNNERTWKYWITADQSDCLLIRWYMIPSGRWSTLPATTKKQDLISAVRHQLLKDPLTWTRGELCWGQSFPILPIACDTFNVAASQILGFDISTHPLRMSGVVRHALIR